MKQIPEEIGEYLSYNPDTGDLTWIKKTGRKVVIGTLAGSSGYKRKYKLVRFNGAGLYNHRVAWFLQTGEQPPEQIDHIDGDKLNNTFTNLRAATPSQNMCNKPRRADNSSGYKGVCWDKDAMSWRAKLTLKGVSKHLGLFPSPEEAYLAYCKAADELHKEFKRYD